MEKKEEPTASKKHVLLKAARRLVRTLSAILSLILCSRRLSFLKVKENGLLLRPTKKRFACTGIQGDHEDDTSSRSRRTRTRRILSLRDREIGIAKGVCTGGPLRAGGRLSLLFCFHKASSHVDTTPTCTRAYAHFSRAHFTHDHCTYGSRLISVARFLKHCHLSIMSLLGGLSLVPLLLLHILLVLCHDPQPRRHLRL